DREDNGALGKQDPAQLAAIRRTAADGDDPGRDEGDRDGGEHELRKEGASVFGLRHRGPVADEEMGAVRAGDDEDRPGDKRQATEPGGEAADGVAAGVGIDSLE